MIRYLVYGERRYGQITAGIAKRRHYWELGCAVRGRIAPLTPGRPHTLHGHRLWAFPPEVAHGWTGDSEPALVIMLQPHQVPDQLIRASARRDRAGRELVWDMQEAEARWLEAEVAALLPDYRSPGPLGTLRQERLVLELAIRLLASLPEEPADDPQGLVEAAVAWIGEHLAARITEADLGRALHVSTSHLRRLFHRHLGSPPRDVLTRLRIERAEHLLGSTRLPIEGVAAACGFASDASFSRAFLRLRGKRPGSWRAEGVAANSHPTHVPVVAPRR